MTKEEILTECCSDQFLDIENDILDGCASDAFKAMDECAEQQAVEFAEWISNHQLDFQTASNGCWIGLDMVTRTSAELYKLFLKSK